MKRVTYTLLLVLLLALLTFNTVHAQSYSFRVEKEVVHVYWNKDGTMSLDYTWDFVNQPSGHPIDFVDVGMPNPNFDISTAKADVNGKPVSVSRSDYQGSGWGFAVVMGSQTIPASSKGKVHVYMRSISNVLYNDEKDQKYVSAAFAPTYFGSQYVVGNTDLTVIFHLPPNIKPEEPRWHDAPSGFSSQPKTELDDEGRITYTWQNMKANGYSKYQFGTSFPRSYIPAESIYVSPIPPPTSRPSSSPTTTTPASNITSLLNNSIGLICVGILAFLLIAAPIQNAIQSRRRKLEYIPPHILIEGHGIKRGLTAVEAAILMEEPLDKVMTMILFGLIKKSAAQVVKRDPPEIKAVDPLPDGLYQYETDFIKAFKDADPDIPRVLIEDKRKNNLEGMTVNLVNSISEKMRGFSRKETIDYYKSIMENAWRQVEDANTPEVKSQKFDENLEWTMLDRNYDHRSRRILTEPVYLPTWWDRYDPDWHSATSHGSLSLPSSQGGTSSPIPSQSRGTASSALPGADFAASVVGGVQIFSQKVIGNIADFTNRVTNVTNPPPAEPSWSRISTSTGTSNNSNSTIDLSDRHSGGWGGGGHSSCACACAGCACACAGGGR